MSTSNWRYFSVGASNNPRDKNAAAANASRLNYDARRSGEPFVYAIRKNKNGTWEIWRRVIGTKSDSERPLKTIDYEAAVRR